VPHFYFDLVSKSGTTVARDDSGADFPDAEAAIEDAERGLADMMSEAVLEGSLDFSAIDIRDEQGQLLTSLHFAEGGSPTENPLAGVSGGAIEEAGDQVPTLDQEPTVLVPTDLPLDARLGQAEDYVVQSAEYVARQRRLVAKFEREGRALTQARAFLAVLEKTHALHVQMRDRLREELHRLARA
jgi:hypothetical protein